MITFSSYKRIPRALKRQQGFTLVELVVSVSIIALVSAIVFWNGRGFNSDLEVTTAAQDASLAVREAQTYAVSVRESSVGSGNFAQGYGIAFNTANPNFLIIFADTNGNGVYDGGTACDGTDECVEKILLRNNVTIQKICATDSNGNNNTCTSPNNGYNGIEFLFVRPNLDATISVRNPAGNVIGRSFQSGSIVLSNSSGASKTLTVNVAGEVALQ